MKKHKIYITVKYSNRLIPAFIIKFEKLFDSYSLFTARG